MKAQRERSEHEFFVTTSRGLNEVIALELKSSFAATHVQLADGKVFFATRIPTWHLRSLRSVERVFVLVARAVCAFETSNELVEFITKLPGYADAVSVWKTSFDGNKAARDMSGVTSNAHTNSNASSSNNNSLTTANPSTASTAPDVLTSCDAVSAMDSLAHSTGTTAVQPPWSPSFRVATKCSGSRARAMGLDARVLTAEIERTLDAQLSPLGFALGKGHDTRGLELLVQVSDVVPGVDVAGSSSGSGSGSGSSSGSSSGNARLPEVGCDPAAQETKQEGNTVTLPARSTTGTAVHRGSQRRRSQSVLIGMPLFRNHINGQPLSTRENVRHVGLRAPVAWAMSAFAFVPTLSTPRADAVMSLSQHLLSPQPEHTSMGWPVVVDMCCGVGTVLLEAADFSLDRSDVVAQPNLNGGEEGKSDRSNILNAAANGGGLCIGGGQRAALYLGGDCDSEQLRAFSENLKSLNTCGQQRTISRCRSPLIECVQWSADNLPLRNASVDIVLSDWPFGHKFGSENDMRSAYPRFLTELTRVLRAGGRAVLLTSQRLHAIVEEFARASDPSASVDTGRVALTVVRRVHLKLGALPAVLVVLVASVAASGMTLASNNKRVRETTSVEPTMDRVSNCADETSAEAEEADGQLDQKLDVAADDSSLRLSVEQLPVPVGPSSESSAPPPAEQRKRRRLLRKQWLLEQLKTEQQRQS